MLLIYYCTLLMVFALTRGNENSLYREEEGRESTDPDNQESFDSPVYETTNSLRPSPFNVNPAYSFSSPPGYGGIPRYGFPYPYVPYSRYGIEPFSVPPAYGAMLSDPAMMCALIQRFGYSCYGGPYSGRSAYPAVPYTFSNYNVAGLSYQPSGIRRALVPVAGAPASAIGVPPPIAQPIAPPVATPIAQSVPSVPFVARFSNDIPGVAAPVVRPWASASSSAGKGGEMSLRKLY